MAGYNSNQSAWPYFPRALPRMVAVPGPSPIPTSNYLDVALPPCDTTYYTNAPIERHFQKTHPWCHPWKVFPYAVSTSLPLCGCNRAPGPQNCLLYDISHLQQDLHPKDSGLSELKAEHPYQTDYSASVANFTVEAERYGASWALPQLRTTQSDATTWQNAAPAHYEGSPLQTEFPAAETELRNEDPVAYEPGWSHDPASSVMVDDNSILAFQASNKSSNNDVSAQPSADTCHAAGAAPSTRPSVLTQTDRPGTAEALVNTEVAMSDLDYLAEEFMKLQRAKEEWKKKKATLKRTLKKPCSCIQRAQQAELSLLALQYSVCRVHCSRLCSNSQGSQSTTTSKTPRANMAGALQKLESDYNHMRQEILTGVPLEQLRPLSVDLTGGSSVPSQINADLAENVQSGHVNLHENASTTEFRETAGKTAPLFCRSPREQQQFLDKEKSSLEFKSEDGKQRKVQMVSSTAACNEMSVSEAWFDAEEYLDDFTCGCSHCLPPCVPIFSSNITEIDMKAQLEKHQATDISACSFQSDMSRSAGPEFPGVAATPQASKTESGGTEKKM